MRKLMILAFALVAFASCEKTEVIDNGNNQSEETPEFSYNETYKEAFLFDYDAYGSGGSSWIKFTNEELIITLDVNNPKMYYADYELEVNVTLYDADTKTIRADVTGDITGEIIFIEGESIMLIADNPTGEPAHFIMY